MYFKTFQDSLDGEMKRLTAEGYSAIIKKEEAFTEELHAGRMRTYEKDVWCICIKPTWQNVQRVFLELFILLQS